MSYRVVVGGWATCERDGGLRRRAGRTTGAGCGPAQEAAVRAPCGTCLLGRQRISPARGGGIAAGL